MRYLCWIADDDIANHRTVEIESPVATLAAVLAMRQLCGDKPNLVKTLRQSARIGVRPKDGIESAAGFYEVRTWVDQGGYVRRSSR